MFVMAVNLYFFNISTIQKEDNLFDFKVNCGIKKIPIKKDETYTRRHMN